MYLIVGLGNPGKKYIHTRHNVGFMALDLIQNEFSLPDFKNQARFKAELSVGQYAGRVIILAKPQTYMNNSGQAVHLVKNYFKIQNENIILIHDDLDINFGDLRIKNTGSSAGHNGVKSVIEALGSQDFWRVRIGIRNKQLSKLLSLPADIKADGISRFVLSRFSFLEKRKMHKDILPAVWQQVLSIINQN